MPSINMKESSAFSFLKKDETSVQECNKLNITKPSVIVLGGNPTINEMESLRNMNIFQSLAGYNFCNKYSSDFDIYSITYNKGYVLNDSYSLSLKYKSEDFTSLAYSIFMPLVSKNELKIDTQKAGENLNKLTFFAHSAGALVMDNVMLSLRGLLRDLKYDRDDINYLFSQISLMAYAPFSVVHFPISSVYITPINDSLNSWVRTYILKEQKDEWSLDFADIEYLRDEYLEKLKGDTAVSYVGYCGDSPFLNITPRELRKDFGEDHNFVGVLRTKEGECPFASDAGKNMSDLMRFYFQTKIKESLGKNKKIPNDEFIKYIQEFLSYYAENKNEKGSLSGFGFKSLQEEYLSLIKRLEKNNKPKGSDSDGWSK